MVRFFDWNFDFSIGTLQVPGDHLGGLWLYPWQVAAKFTDWTHQERSIRRFWFRKPIHLYGVFPKCGTGKNTKHGSCTYHDISGITRIVRKSPIFLGRVAPVKIVECTISRLTPSTQFLSHALVVIHQTYFLFLYLFLMDRWSRATSRTRTASVVHSMPCDNIG